MHGWGWPICVVVLGRLFMGAAARAGGQPAEAPGRHGPAGENDARCRVPLLDDDEVWVRLPPVEDASGGRMPHWARALAGTLPRTTAPMLDLDYLYRTI